MWVVTIALTHVLQEGPLLQLLVSLTFLCGPMSIWLGGILLSTSVATADECALWKKNSPQGAHPTEHAIWTLFCRYQKIWMPYLILRIVSSCVGVLMEWVRLRPASQRMSCCSKFQISTLADFEVILWCVILNMFWPEPGFFGSCPLTNLPYASKVLF